MIDPDLEAWLETAFDLSEELPDARWVSHLEDAVRAFNRRHRTAHDPAAAVGEFLGLEVKEGVKGC